MKLFEKVKNMFTEEIEDEQPVKKEIRHVEIQSPKKEIVEEVNEESKKEEKLLFFDDKDFEDLEREEEKVIKPIPKKVEPLPYQGVKPIISDEPKKVFKPSPIISPVYGVLDKNYHKEDIVTKKTTSISYRNDKLTVDDVRQRAFSTLEDELKNEILDDDYIVSRREPVEDDLDIFKDIEENELNYQDDGIKIAKEDIIESDSKLDDDFLEDTEYLSQKLEEQKRKLDEINDIINDSKSKTRSVDEFLYREREEKTADKETTEIEEIEEAKPVSLEEAYNGAMDDLEEASTKTETKKLKSKKKDMTDSELLNLIDSMYEKSDEDE